VEPLLVFNNFLIAVAAITMRLGTSTWQDWVAVAILCLLVPILFVEHQKESKTIFVSDW
jgi:hypothetical protein